MFEPLFKIVYFLKMIVGIGIIIKATELFENGYISTGLIEGINIFISESPELTTYLVLIMIGIKTMR